MGEVGKAMQRVVGWCAFPSLTHPNWAEQAPATPTDSFIGLNSFSSPKELPGPGLQWALGYEALKLKRRDAAEELLAAFWGPDRSIWQGDSMQAARWVASVSSAQAAHWVLHPHLW